MALLTASFASDAVKETSLFFFLAFSWCQFLLSNDLRSFFTRLWQHFSGLLFSQNERFSAFSPSLCIVQIWPFSSQGRYWPPFLIKLACFFILFSFKENLFPVLGGKGMCMARVKYEQRGDEVILNWSFESGKSGHQMSSDWMEMTTFEPTTKEHQT